MQVTPAAYHPARNCERRFLDELFDLESGADLWTDLLIAVAGFGPGRSNPYSDDRFVRRGETDRIGERAAILGGCRDVVIGRDRGDDSVAQPALDNRGAVGDCHCGAARVGFNNQVIRRDQAADRTPKRRLMRRRGQHENSLARDERHMTRDRIREQAGLAVNRKKRLGPCLAARRPKARAAAARDNQHRGARRRGTSSHRLR
jgi:hypothetical protein